MKIPCIEVPKEVVGVEEHSAELLKDLLKNKKYKELRTAFTEMNEVDIAEFISGLPRLKATIAFRTLPKDTELEVFAELDADVQCHIIESITDAEIAEIMEDLYVDDAVDMLEEMPSDLVKRVLENSAPEMRAVLNSFLRYPEYSVGSIMTAEFTDLKRDMTVEDAIKRIRRTGADRETIYSCYVIDDTRKLEGVVTVKDLLLSPDTATVETIMGPDVISAVTTDDQEKAAQLMARYGFISLPAVDAENRLVGVVTVDDVMQVIREEDTEDFEKMAAMTPSEKPYLRTSVWALAKNRFPWLLVLMVSGMFTGLILNHYGPVNALFPPLVTFIPMLMGTGGNAGSQSSTMVIRGMVLGEIEMRSLPAVVWKEVRVGVLVGVALALVNYVRLLLTFNGNALIPLVVSLSLIASVFFAKLIGGALPMLARACKVDPALMAAPLITTLVDAIVLVIYFNIARVILY